MPLPLKDCDSHIHFSSLFEKTVEAAVAAVEEAAAVEL